MILTPIDLAGLRPAKYELSTRVALRATVVCIATLYGGFVVMQ